MIVIDEQLLGEGIEATVGKWYPGSVLNVIDLRPNTLIKDEAIPALLRLPASERYCLVCMTLTTSESPEISALLRRLLRHPDFKTKAKRCGKVVRITLQGSASFYSIEDKSVRPIVGF